MLKARRFVHSLWVPLFLVILGSAAWAQEQNPKVAIMPFTVRGQQEPIKIQKAIEELLVRQLTTEGARVVSPQDVEKVVRPGESVATEEQGRALGRRLQAEYVLVGSFNQIGNSISLDAKLVDVAGRKNTEIIFAEDKGMENLAAATNTIVQRMAVHLLAKAVIAEVQIRGTERIEPDAIRLNIKSRKGEVLKPEVVADDIKSVYKMGFFENVDADVSDTPAGKVLAFVVRENPTIQEVHITGNKKIKEKDILAAISTRPYSIVQKNVISEDVQKIVKVYHQKGYFTADIKSSIDFPKDPRKAVVTFAINENAKVFIRKISFTGNKNFSAWKLRSIMETKEKMMLISWFTERGILQRDMLDTDIDRLTVFYHDKGFMDAKVGTPEVSLKDDGFYIEIPVEEGDRYRVDDVKVNGGSFGNQRAPRQGPEITTERLLRSRKTARGYG